MFQTPEGYGAMQQEVESIEGNYVLRKNDKVTLAVYTHDGERIIDPDFVLSKDLPNQSNLLHPEYEYPINDAGEAKFPKLGNVHIEGLTIREAEALLQERYTEFYANTFVVLRCTNKRVVILGAPGGKVIPLDNDGVRLSEVIALAGGVDNNANADNIRVLRGEKVWVADLSTAEGYRKYNMVMQSGDVVYVEPIRRPLSEGLRDYGPVISIVTSLTTLIVVILGL